jgi:hypothetical protein
MEQRDDARHKLSLAIERLMDVVPLLQEVDDELTVDPLVRQKELRSRVRDLELKVRRVLEECKKPM